MVKKVSMRKPFMLHNNIVDTNVECIEFFAVLIDTEDKNSNNFQERYLQEWTFAQRKFDRLDIATSKSA